MEATQPSVTYTFAQQPDVLRGEPDVSKTPEEWTIVTVTEQAPGMTFLPWWIRTPALWVASWFSSPQAVIEQTVEQVQAQGDIVSYVFRDVITFNQQTGSQIQTSVPQVVTEAITMKMKGPSSQFGDGPRLQLGSLEHTVQQRVTVQAAAIGMAAKQHFESKGEAPSIVVYRFYSSDRKFSHVVIAPNFDQNGEKKHMSVAHVSGALQVPRMHAPSDLDTD